MRLIIWDKSEKAWKLAVHADWRKREIKWEETLFVDSATAFTLDEVLAFGLHLNRTDYVFFQKPQ